MPRTTKKIAQRQQTSPELDSRRFAEPWLRDLIYWQCDAYTLAKLRNVCNSMREEVDKHTLRHRYILVPAEQIMRHDSYTNLAMQELRQKRHHQYDSKGNAREGTEETRRLQARFRPLDVAFLQQARHVAITGAPGTVLYDNHPLCRGNCNCGHPFGILCSMRSLCPNLRRLVTMYGPLGPASKAWEDDISRNAWNVDWNCECQLTDGTTLAHITLSQWQLDNPVAFAPRDGGPLSVIQDFCNARLLHLKARHAVNVKSQYIDRYQARRPSKAGKKYTRTLSDRELMQLRKEEKAALTLRRLMASSTALHLCGSNNLPNQASFAQALEEHLERRLNDRWRYWLTLPQHGAPFQDLFDRFQYQNIQVYFPAANVLRMVVDDADECQTALAYEYLEDKQRWRTKPEHSVVQRKERWQNHRAP